MSPQAWANFDDIANVLANELDLSLQASTSGQIVESAGQTYQQLSPRDSGRDKFEKDER